jgi:hypothetical protein
LKRIHKRIIEEALDPEDLEAIREIIASEIDAAREDLEEIEIVDDEDCEDEEVEVELEDIEEALEEALNEEGEEPVEEDETYEVRPMKNKGRRPAERGNGDEKKRKEYDEDYPVEESYSPVVDAAMSFISTSLL